MDAAADAEETSAASTTIYVKNLAFGTADAALRKHFDAAVSAASGVVRSAMVQKSQPKADGKDKKALSAGYGFVECSSEDVAKAVIRRLQVRPPGPASWLPRTRVCMRLSQGI